VRETFETAWTAGVRYVDTAPHYGLGLSERRLGALLAERTRDDFVLSTKVGRLLVPSLQPDAEDLAEGFAVPATLRREWDLSRDGIRRSIEDSLERLGLDRIDIAFLHDPDERMDEAVAEAMPALIELREEGVLRAVGAGMNDSAPLTRFVRECDIDVVLCAGRYTLLDQSALADLMPAATERGVGVVIGGVYNSGLLAVDRPGADATFDYVRAPAERIERAHAIADVCERHGVTLPQAALAFVNAHPAVVSTVIGMRHVGDAEEAVARAAAEVPAELWDDLRSAGLIPADAPTS
jgi:D-threo-aldose 1-dehydrogenase